MEKLQIASDMFGIHRNIFGPFRKRLEDFEKSSGVALNIFGKSWQVYNKNI